MQLDDPLIQVPRFHRDWVEKDNNPAVLIGWSEEETLVVSRVRAMAMVAGAYQLEYQVILNIHFSFGSTSSASSTNTANAHTANVLPFPTRINSTNSAREGSEYPSSMTYLLISRRKVRTLSDERHELI